MSRHRSLAPLAAGFMLAWAGACLAGEATPPVSPWGADFWRAVSPQSRQYICDHAKLKPGWCGMNYDFSVVQDVPGEELHGPLLTASDARWLRMIAAKKPDDLTADDADFISRRAMQTGDPDAMEVLGYLYARGIAVARNIESAYIWYGRAFLRGRDQVKKNMDILWAEINKRDVAAAQRITRLFEREAKAQKSASGGRLSEGTGAKTQRPAGG